MTTNLRNLFLSDYEKNDYFKCAVILFDMDALAIEAEILFYALPVVWVKKIAAIPKFRKRGASSLFFTFTKKRTSATP
jgi:hypothetical protein